MHASAAFSDTPGARRSSISRALQVSCLCSPFNICCNLEFLRLGQCICSQLFWDLPSLVLEERAL